MFWCWFGCWENVQTGLTAVIWKTGVSFSKITWKTHFQLFSVFFINPNICKTQLRIMQVRTIHYIKHFSMWKYTTKQMDHKSLKKILFWLSKSLCLRFIPFFLIKCCQLLLAEGKWRQKMKWRTLMWSKKQSKICLENKTASFDWWEEVLVRKPGSVKLFAVHIWLM